MERNHMKTVIIDENYEGIEKFNHFWFVYKGDMEISGNLKININLIIEGNQTVRGNLTVKGHQLIKGNQIIEGNQIIKGEQVVKGNQLIKGYQIIKDNQKIEGYQKIKRYQRIEGNQTVDNYQMVKNEQIVKGAQTIKGEMEILGFKTKFSLSFIQDKYQLYFMSDLIKIGCQTHSPEKWKNFSDKEISDMDKGALEWWNRWKKFVLNTHENLVEVYSN